MHKYKLDSPFVKAAIDLLGAGARFENFGALEDKVARITFKQQWIHDARALFDAGQVAEASITEKRERGRPAGREFRIVFHPQQTTFKGKPVTVTPSVAIRLDSLDELRSIAKVYREQRSFEKNIKDPSARDASKPSEAIETETAKRRRGPRTGGPI